MVSRWLEPSRWSAGSKTRPGVAPALDHRVALMAYSTAALGDLFPNEQARIEAATTLNSTASMVALFGRIYDPSSLGALAMIKYSAFMTAALTSPDGRHHDSSHSPRRGDRTGLLSSGRLGRNCTDRRRSGD